VASIGSGHAGMQRIDCTCSAPELVGFRLGVGCEQLECRRGLPYIRTKDIRSVAWHGTQRGDSSRHLGICDGVSCGGVVVRRQRIL